MRRRRKLKEVRHKPRVDVCDVVMLREKKDQNESGRKVSGETSMDKRRRDMLEEDDVVKYAGESRLQWR